MPSLPRTCPFFRRHGTFHGNNSDHRAHHENAQKNLFFQNAEYFLEYFPPWWQNNPGRKSSRSWGCRITGTPSRKPERWLRSGRYPLPGYRWIIGMERQPHTSLFTERKNLPEKIFQISPQGVFTDFSHIGTFILIPSFVFTSYHLSRYKFQYNLSHRLVKHIA